MASVKVPPHARAGAVGRGHRFAAYPRCSADSEVNTGAAAAIVVIQRRGWVGVDAIRRIRGGVELILAVSKRRGEAAVGSWWVRCRGLRELHLADLNGGGIRIYSSNHPAARQYSAKLVDLSWEPQGRASEALGVLLVAHTRLVDDWIPFDRYTRPFLAAASRVKWRGPDFIMRAYATALRQLGLQPQIRPRQKRNGCRAKCLHFGDSFIVAERFEVGSGAA
jgi:hypothetical protein